MLKAGPRLLVLEGLHGSRLTAHPGTASVAFFLILVLGRHVVSKPVIPPKQKNRPGRYHVSPKSAKRSINFCKIPVKRKTLNVVDVFVPCLLVVVMFRVHMPRFFCSIFNHLAQYTKASKPWLTDHFSRACAKLLRLPARSSRQRALCTRKLPPAFPRQQPLRALPLEHRQKN